MPDSTAYIFNRASLLFFLIIGQSNSVVSTSLVTFSAESRLLSRERAKKMYRTLPYFIAVTLSDMVHSVTFPTLYGVIVYWICNLRPTAHAFFVFVLTLYLTISAAQVNFMCLPSCRHLWLYQKLTCALQSTGLFLSVAIPNTNVALRLAPILTICVMVIGGFYVPLDLISPFLAWASWLSMARYVPFCCNDFFFRALKL
jgi:hypothetical protein